MTPDATPTVTGIFAVVSLRIWVIWVILKVTWKSTFNWFYWYGDIKLKTCFLQREPCKCKSRIEPCRALYRIDWYANIGVGSYEIAQSHLRVCKEIHCTTFFPQCAFICDCVSGREGSQKTNMSIETRSYSSIFFRYY